VSQQDADLLEIRLHQLGQRLDVDGSLSKHGSYCCRPRLRARPRYPKGAPPVARPAHSPVRDRLRHLPMRSTWRARKPYAEPR
jgi:hypothetical protein